jgi:hypothetical protein
MKRDNINKGRDHDMLIMLRMSPALIFHQCLWSVDVLLTSLEQMMRLFLVNGFAWDGTASMKSSSNNGAGATFSLTFTSPATLWSGQALLARKANLLNNFALKVALVMAQDAGYKILTSSTHYSGNKEISEFTVA